MTCDVSILVPLSESADAAMGCLQALAELPAEPSFEVVVVADAAPWLEGLLAQLDGDVTILRTDRPAGPAGAVALAVERIAAPVTALITEAAQVCPDFLAGLVAILDDPAVGTAVAPTGADRGPAAALTALAAAWRSDDLRRAITMLSPTAPAVSGLALTLADRGLRIATGPAGRIRAPAISSGHRHPPGTPPELTVVIPTLDAGSERMRRCLTAIRGATEAAHEVVIVDNGAPAQGFSDPVNAGLRAARTPYVVVMNDDVEVLPGWWSPLRAALDAGAAVTFPLTVDGAMRTDFAAWCFAASRDTLARFGHAPGAFFDPSLVIWFQDTDLLVRLRQAGRPPQLIRESRIRHGLSQTLATPDAVLSDWVQRQIAADQSQFAAKHPQIRLAAGALQA